MAEARNGKTTLVWILASLLIAGLGGVGSAAVHMMISVNDRMECHEILPGHPIVTEKVNRVEQDIAEIKTDIRAILGKLK